MTKINRFTIESVAKRFGVIAERIIPRKCRDNEIYLLNGQEENIKSFWGYLSEQGKNSPHRFRKLNTIVDGEINGIYIGRVRYEVCR